MTKKYLNELYKEIIQIKRKIKNKSLKYFGSREYGNAFYYHVILKDGSHFYVTLGTNTIPDIRKKDIAYIGKQVDCDSTCTSWKKWVDFIDTDRGRTRTGWYDSYDYLSKYEESKYYIDTTKEFYTGYFD